jgi:thiol-disulfide isomerase/thioredoxin
LTLSGVLDAHAASFAEKACKPVTPNELDGLVASEKATHVVFFASWCASCKIDLAAKYERPLFVATFDTPSAAAKAFFSVEAVAGKPCYFDTDNAVARAWKVGGVPHVREIGK